MAILHLEILIVDEDYKIKNTNYIMIIIYFYLKILYRLSISI